MTRRISLALTLAVGLAACGSDTPDTVAEGDDRSARGEVLGGTISDEMIPLDQLQSQSPPLRERGAASETSAASPAETSSDETDPGTETENAAEAEAPAAPEEPAEE